MVYGKKVIPSIINGAWWEWKWWWDNRGKVGEKMNGKILVWNKSERKSKVHCELFVLLSEEEEEEKKFNTSASTSRSWSTSFSILWLLFVQDKILLISWRKKYLVIFIWFLLLLFFFTFISMCMGMHFAAVCVRWKWRWEWEWKWVDM